MQKANLKPLGIGLAGGLIGLTLGLGIWHAWLDHVAFHQDHATVAAVVQLINQANAKQQGQPPAAAVAPPAK